MLLSSIVLPFMALLSPFQDTMLDDLRTARLGPRALVHRNTIAKNTLSGIFIASVFISYQLFREEMYDRGYLLDSEDAIVARPPAYVEERLSRPHTSSLLRTFCIAQKIYSPPTPTCINTAVKPNFEYAPKSPAPPAFPVHHRTCSVQAMAVFVDDEMTMLYLPNSRNTLVFLEPAQSTAAATLCPGSSNAPIAVVMIALVKLTGLLATFLAPTMVWVGLVSIVIFRPSIYALIVGLIQNVEGIDLDLVITIPKLDNGKGEENGTDCEDNGSKRSEGVLATRCQSNESPEETTHGSSTMFEPSTPSNAGSLVCLGSRIISSVVFEPSALPAHSDSDDTVLELVDASSRPMLTVPEPITPPPLLSDMGLSVSSISLDLAALSLAGCELSSVCVQESSLSQVSPVFSPAVFGPPLLLNQDSGSATGSPSAVLASNTPTEVLFDAKPLNPTPNMFTSHSSHSSTHAQVSHLALTALLPILNPTACTSTPHLLHSSVHTPAFQPTVLSLPAPEQPKPLNRSALNSAAQPFFSELRSSIHSPGSLSILSPPRMVERPPAVKSATKHFFSELHSSMHAPVSPPALSPARGPEHRAVLNAAARPFISGLRSSMHAPVSPPCALEHRPALNPATRPFLPGAPKFFAQAQAHSARVVIVSPPPKKRRVRSLQMKERKAAQRAAAGCGEGAGGEA